MNKLEDFPWIVYLNIENEANKVQFKGSQLWELKLIGVYLKIYLPLVHQGVSNGK